MIARLPESSGNVVGFRIQGKLTDEDYKEGLIPPLEQAIAENRKIRMLMLMEDFKGWTARGAWDDFFNWPKFVAVERLAIVIDENWHDFMTSLFKAFARVTHMELRFFSRDRLEEAWAFLRAP